MTNKFKGSYVSKESQKKFKRALGGRVKAKRYPEPSGHRLRRYLGMISLTSSKQDAVSMYRAMYTGASKDYMRETDAKNLLEIPKSIKRLIELSTSQSAKAHMMKKFSLTGSRQEKIAKFVTQRDIADEFNRRSSEMRKDGNQPSKPEPNSSKGLVNTTVIGAKETNKEILAFREEIRRMIVDLGKSPNITVTVSSAWKKSY